MYIRLNVAHQKGRHKTEKGGECVVGEPRERHRKGICGGYDQDALNTCISFAKSKFVLKNGRVCVLSIRRQKTQLGSWWMHKREPASAQTPRHVTSKWPPGLSPRVLLSARIWLWTGFFSYCSLSDTSVQSRWQGVPTVRSLGRQWSNTICTRVLKPFPSECLEFISQLV